MSLKKVGVVFQTRVLYRVMALMGKTVAPMSRCMLNFFWFLACTLAHGSVGTVRSSMLGRFQFWSAFLRPAVVLNVLMGAARWSKRWVVVCSDMSAHSEKQQTCDNLPFGAA